MTVDPRPVSSRMETPAPNYQAQHRARLLRFLERTSGKKAKSDRWLGWFRGEVHRLVAQRIAPGHSVLDVGCGDGALLARLHAQPAVGVDIDATALATATQRLPEAELLNTWAEDFEGFRTAPFDYIILTGVLEQVYDIHTVLKRLALFTDRRTRVVITSYSRIAQPFLRALELTRLRPRNPVENWIPPHELRNLLDQAGFEVVEHSQHLLVPFRIPGISSLVNRWVAPLPVIREFCLVNLTVARSRVFSSGGHEPMVSVVVAARNERDNIEPLLERLPRLSERQEVVFVEGGSSDGTFERIRELAEGRQVGGYPFPIVALKQTGKGKGDAIRTGFAHASGDIFVILDADLSVPPEELSTFIDLLRRGDCDFANGSRLVYPMDDQAMQFLNLLGNRFFGTLFSYLIGQPIRDTLCGTKALWASDYQRIALNRKRFGDFDPFGDFDLLFGAAHLGLRIRDVPVHYKERVYGSTNISRFRHGLLLFRMSWIAAKRLRFT